MGESCGRFLFSNGVVDPTRSALIKIQTAHRRVDRRLFFFSVNSGTCDKTQPSGRWEKPLFSAFIRNPGSSLGDQRTKVCRTGGKSCCSEAAIWQLRPNCWHAFALAGLELDGLYVACPGQRAYGLSEKKMVERKIKNVALRGLEASPQGAFFKNQLLSLSGERSLWPSESSHPGRSA